MGVLPYLLYRYAPKKVWFLAILLKSSVSLLADLSNFGLKIRYFRSGVLKKYICFKNLEGGDKN